MKSRSLTLSAALLLCFSFASCNQTNEFDSPSSGADIPTELAHDPSSETSSIVDGVKRGEIEASALVEDVDHDLVADASDNCPTVSNQDQVDEDGDGLGDACANL